MICRGDETEKILNITEDKRTKTAASDVYKRQE